MSKQIWHGVESEKTTRQKLRNGDVVRSYEGAFTARKSPVGGVLEKCIMANTWETKYRTADEYVTSLYETLL